MLENFMQQLCKEIDIDPPLAPQMPGVYNFPLEDDLSVTITALQPQGVKFACTIAPCPKAKQEELFTQMLLANLFGQGTRGAVLALDEDGEKVLLHRVIDYRIEYRDFRDFLEDFINAVDLWKDELKAYA